jgi:1-pyrroline-5-carboxylate dehydrogenase
MSRQQNVTYAAAVFDEAMHDAYENALIKIPAMLGERHPLFIGKQELFSPTQFETRSPIDTSIRIGAFQNATNEQIHDAIAQSRQEYGTWSRVLWQDRVSILRKVADVLDSQRFLLSALITYEIGKTRAEAIAEVAESVDMIRYYCDLYNRHDGYETRMEPGELGQTARSVIRPYGVWAVISPFNFPISLAAGMAGAVLLTGNTAILKPTSESPFSGLKLYHAFREGGVPPGALQFITGPGKVFGEAIVSHPGIAGIAFTGSRDAGTWLHRNFVNRQPYAKPVVLEMGSKNPVIVTEHADTGKAAAGIVRSAFGYGGQKCSATSRVYVQECIMPAFTVALMHEVAALKTDDPREKGTGLGPLINATAVARFRSAVAEAKEAGATILCGGDVLTGNIFDRGYYVSPTVIMSLPPHHRLEREELFLPFLIVETYAGFDDALQRASATDFGLTAGIFSEDVSEVTRFFDRIESGVCYANRRGGATTGAWPGSQPFCGWKASGFSGKGTGGPYYLLSFVREQAQTRAG